MEASGKWTEIGIQDFWERALPKYKQMNLGVGHLPDEYDKNNQEHRKIIHHMAIGRFGPTSLRDY